MRGANRLDQAIVSLRNCVEDTRLVLDTPGVEHARTLRREIVQQVDDHVLPRMRHPGAPILVVVGGSTGVGKSTVVNTLIRERVTSPGVRRPTTRSPVLVCNPKDAPWFVDGGPLAELPRVREPTDGLADDVRAPVMAEVDDLPRGVALLDNPDIDSVEDIHRAIASTFAIAADVWLHVTTPARYADAAPWRLLRAAHERGATLALVLNRVPSEGGDDVRTDLAAMLDEAGVEERVRFSVPETTVHEGLLPIQAVEPLRSWLTEIADDATRAETAARVLDGALDSFRIRAPSLARHVESQAAATAELRSSAEAAYAAALTEVDEATRNGSLLSGEVLIRWQDFVGTGEALRALRAQAGPLRSRFPRRRPRRAAGGDDLRSALTATLRALVVTGAEQAAGRAVESWRAHPAAAPVLDAADGPLEHASPQAERRASAAVSGWCDYVLEAVRGQGATKRSVSRVLSSDPDGLGLVLIVGLLGYATGDIPVASGTSALPQRLLSTLFGAESLRTIGAKARQDLRMRVAAVFDDEALRFIEALERADLADDAAIRLYQATYALEEAR
ncbi:MAG: AAA family ATPase [Streptosporangiaceae bacterium]